MVRQGAKSRLRVPLAKVARVEDVVFALAERGPTAPYASLLAQPMSRLASLNR
jgi:hypothetical protein